MNPSNGGRVDSESAPFSIGGSGRPAAAHDPPYPPQLRYDILDAEWRLIPAGRQDRPVNPEAGTCPFCPGGLEAPGDYTVRVFPNRWPPLAGAGPDAGASMPLTLPPGGEPTAASGTAEVILYTPDHEGALGDLGDGQLRAVMDAWAERHEVLGARADVAYVLCFENRGADVGATIPHPHGQIYGFPFVPPRLTRIHGANACRICADSNSAQLLLASSELARCWVPGASAWPHAFRIAPVRHAQTLSTLTDEEAASVRNMLSRALRALDNLWGRPLPYMLDLHQRPTDGGRWPHSHMWFEVASPMRAPGVMRYVAAGEVGSGVYQNPVAPEDAHAALAAAWPGGPTS